MDRFPSGNACFHGWLVLCAGLLLGACAQVDTLIGAGSTSTDGPGCLRVRVPLEPEGAQQNRGAKVTIGKELYYPGYETPQGSFVCGENALLPAVGEWKNEQGQSFRVEVDFRAGMPAGFLDDRSNELVFHFTGDDRFHVGYLMRLSALTRRELPGAETPAQRAQRALDEALWQAIGARDGARVRSLIAQGANADQPWMSTDPAGQRTSVLGHAIRAGDADMLCVLLAHGAPLRDSPYSSVLSLPVGRGETLKAAALLEHGANPDHRVEARLAGVEAFGGMRLIEAAVVMGKSDMVELLLGYRANIDFNQAHDTPFLLWARDSANPGLYAMLIRPAGQAPPRQRVCAQAR